MKWAGHGYSSYYATRDGDKIHIHGTRRRWIVEINGVAVDAVFPRLKDAKRYVEEGFR